MVGVIINFKNLNYIDKCLSYGIGIVLVYCICYLGIIGFVMAGSLGGILPNKV